MRLRIYRICDCLEYANRDITVIRTRSKAATLNAFDIKAPRHGWRTTNM